MFDHSVKVPRHYKAAANILKKVCTEGGSIKTLIYDSKFRHFNVRSLYALVTTAVRNARALTSLLSDVQLLEKEPRLDPWLARILTIEILLGKKSLPGHSKPEQTLLSYKEQIEYFPIKHPELFDFKGPRRPRYVRVNTIKISIEEFIQRFQGEGYNFQPCTTGSYSDFLDQVRSVGIKDFLQDYHVKCIFVFHPSAKFHDHELCLDGRMFLQDKASALAVELLAPERGAAILDMCAAPGMKTTHAAAYVNNRSKMYAVERNRARADVLYDLVRKSGADYVNVIHADVFKVETHLMTDVQYIILDPSCSGSGMDYNLGDYTKEEEETKLEKLTALQEKLLRFAMTSFPRAKRIVYSTCSLLPEENENVIVNVIKGSKLKWEVQSVRKMLKGQWHNYGEGKKGSIATKCLYAKPESDLTKGFFLAVLDKNPNALSRSISNMYREQHLKETHERNAIMRAKKREEKRERKLAAKLAAQPDYVPTEEKVESKDVVEKKEVKSYNEEDEEELEINTEMMYKDYNVTGCSYFGHESIYKNIKDVVIDCTKAINTKKRYSRSLNNITDNMSGLAMEDEIPRKRRKLNDPEETKAFKPSVSFLSKKIKNRAELSEKKKRRKDMDVDEEAGQSHKRSKSVSSFSKNKNKKKYMET